MDWLLLYFIYTGVAWIVFQNMDTEESNITKRQLCFAAFLWPILIPIAALYIMIKDK